MTSVNGAYLTVVDNQDRVAKQGNWPSYIDVNESLAGRIEPITRGEPGSGFDAGIACCLDLIPRDKQTLASTLHANYTPEAVEQVRTEIALALNGEEDAADYESIWWLAACSFCDEQQDATKLLKAIDGLLRVKYDSFGLVVCALEEYEKMTHRFKLVGDLAVAVEDGGMQGAYIAGHELAIQPMFGTWFVGTFRESLGIPDDFVWGTELDREGRPMSGPVHGSKNFVKCYTLDELSRVVGIADRHLGG
jgi:hypothetical protein